MADSKVSSRRFTTRFRHVANILHPAIKAVADGNAESARETMLSIAKGLNVSFDTIDSWRRGVRCIPETQIAPLVHLLFPNADANEMVRRLNDARDKDEPIRSWKEHVENGHELRVQEARYAGAGKFWGRIFFPFLDSASIFHTSDAGVRPSLTFDQLQDAVWSGKLDVALGILSTPRLSLKLWFYQSPIHFRINCIAPSEFVDRYGLPRIRKLLACRRSSREIFMPILMRGEVGERYASILRLSEHGEPIWAGSLDADEFCKKFKNNRSRADGRIPLIIVDEITCLEILAQLKDQAKLVFPLLPDISDRRTLIPPSFSLGICVSRNEQVGHAKKSELMAFIQDALTSYIAGNADSVAFYYVALRNRIKELADQALPEYSEKEREEWLARSFSLRPELTALQPAHWRGVLQKSTAVIEQDESKGPKSGPRIRLGQKIV